MLCVLHYDENGTTFGSTGTQYAYHILVANLFQKAEKAETEKYLVAFFVQKRSRSLALIESRFIRR